MEPDWRIEALKTFVPIVAAFIVGGFAIRNARKTPHERLKNLVDIAKDMPEGLDVDQSVQRAITAELVDFERLMAASRKGFWAKRKEHVIQHRFRYTAAIAVCVGAAVAVGAGYMAHRQLDGFTPPAAAVLTIAASLIAFALSTSRAASDRRSALKRADELWVIKHNRRLRPDRDTETEPDLTPESRTD
ncbi:hypothetical protein KHP11_27610 [Rhodococcus erythropolis]|uniref:hypothetical protein n=1 Tax=Rhodococcus erythropolis TaxID=1833 RepID=UPI0008A108DE|nr:hypothetical protein [Rhodococcus erythropolis]MBT1258238.1 hypothetical protein [Rhodococcus erythropolis]OHF24521.1 hypothetical protein BKP30_29340 [Rhodococcus erythropolis]